VLHVDAGEVEAGGFEKGEDGRIADHVDPGADLDFAVVDCGSDGVGFHAVCLCW